MRSFGQVSPLTTTLRNVLRDYGAGQVLNEQLQNADDAGASRCAVVLDEGSYGRERVAHRSLAALQGAALLFYDDAEFREDDFESIRLVGDGKKRGDPTKTGQFGLGFNSAYHVTDAPAFVSGKRLVVFDPHCTMFEGPGAMFEDCDEDEGLADQLSPFKFVERLVGCGEGPRTIFRFALRQKPSKLSSTVLSAEECWREVVEPFRRDLQRRLLFLKRVRSIEIYRGAELVARASREGGTGAFWTALCSAVERHGTYARAMQCERPPRETASRVEAGGERWLVATAFGDEAQTRRGLKLSLMPYAAVALGPAGGVLYASLPTPVKTGLPALVDGRFELSRDRNALKKAHASRKRDENSQRADWNAEVMPLVVANAYAVALRHVDEPRRYLPDFPWDRDDEFGALVARRLFDRLVQTNLPVFDGLGARDALFYDEPSDATRLFESLGCPVRLAPRPYARSLRPGLGESSAFSPATAVAWLRATRPEITDKASCRTLLEFARGQDLLGLRVVACARGVAEYGPDLLLETPHLAPLVSSSESSEEEVDDKTRGAALDVVDASCAALVPARRMDAGDVARSTLPASWRGRDLVLSSEADDWLRRFWRAVSYAEAAATPAVEWPLLPCVGGRLVSLARVGIVVVTEETRLAELEGLEVADASKLDDWTRLPTADLATLVARLLGISWTAGVAVRDAALRVVAAKRLVEACGPSVDEDIARLPVFPFVDGRRAPMTEPRFFARREDESSSPRTLARPSTRAVAALYEALGARESAVVAHWASRFDEWPRLDASERLAEMRRLRRDLDCDETVAGRPFVDWVAEQPLLWNDAGEDLFPIAEALDPREPLHAEFFPSRLVPAEVATDEWLPFLLRAGMRLGVSRADVARAARLAAGGPKDRARLVVETTFRYVAATGDDGDWLAEIGELRLAEPRYGGSLVAFQGNVLPISGASREHYSSWSRRVVVSSFGATPRLSTIRALGAEPTASAEDVARHLAYLAAHKPELDRRFRDDRVTLRDQLGCCYESLGYLLASSGADVAFRDDAPIVLLRGGALARPSRVFAGLDDDDDAPPVVYSLRRADDNLLAAAARYPRLAAALGASAGKPRLAQLETWSAEPHGSVDAAIRLARLAYKLYGHGAMRLPDSAGAIRPAVDTLYDDAPWLERRVDKSKLPLAHPALERKVVQALGAEPTSRAVVETADFVVESTTRFPELEAWQRLLTSPAFAAAVRRARRDVDATRLARLRATRLVAASKLGARYRYRELDATAADAESSPALRADDVIYVLVAGDKPGRRCRASLATVVDRYLELGDRALVGELLGVDALDELVDVLDAYEIPSLELDMRLGTPGETCVAGDRPAVGDVVLADGARVKILAEIDRETLLCATSPDLVETAAVRRDALVDLVAERKAREALVARAALVEPEPPGVDDVYLEEEGEASQLRGGDTVRLETTTRTRTSPGFDLVRVDVANALFFHHRPTLHELYDDAGRRRLVKEAALVLDRVAAVFGYDPAKVALFFQRGAVSRFVRQKLFFNLAPLDKRRRHTGADLRADPFAYCYFFGLFVHKLAHFFDVVHGTRHHFFMTEFRCHFALNFVALLARQGFDPAQVEAQFPHLIHHEVF